MSFGKDSLAMLLLLIEKGYPLDEVVYFNTGWDFQAIYDIRDRLKPKLTELNIKFTEVEPRVDFNFLAHEKVVNEGKKNEHLGYSWCGGRANWGTREKNSAIEKYMRHNHKDKDCYVYVGIAADEQHRTKNKEPNKLFPLIE